MSARDDRFGALRARTRARALRPQTNVPTSSASSSASADSAAGAAERVAARPDRAAVRRVTRVEVASDRGVFMISVAAELARMHPQTLRTYEARGLIAPQRSPKGTRLYSREDVDKLRRIQEMTAELGLNLAGVETVLALEAEVAQMRARVAELEARERQAEQRLADAIEDVRRSFRAELVPYGTRAGTALVRALDARSPFLAARFPSRAGGPGRAGGSGGSGSTGGSGSRYPGRPGEDAA